MSSNPPPHPLCTTHQAVDGDGGKSEASFGNYPLFLLGPNTFKSSLTVFGRSDCNCVSGRVGGVYAKPPEPRRNSRFHPVVWRLSAVLRPVRILICCVFSPEPGARWGERPATRSPSYSKRGLISFPKYNFVLL